MRILGKEKPPPEPVAAATSKLKKLPGKTKPATLTLKRRKKQTVEPPLRSSSQSD